VTDLSSLEAVPASPEGASAGAATVNEVGGYRTATGQRGVRMVVDGSPMSARQFFHTMWLHREVMSILARKDFQVRYKRASFGVLWAVAMPLLQGVVMIVVFSHFIRSQGDFSYAMFVLAGTLGWGYFGLTINAATTAIVDGSTFTDKVWFPRALLTMAPVLGNVVSLAAAMVVALIAVPIVGAPITVRLVLLLPACLLLFAFTTALTLVTSAAYVYFRDVKFIVQAVVLVWFYVTPILYPTSLLGTLGPWMKWNPMTGIVTLFQTATAGHVGPVAVPVLISVGFTAVLFVLAVALHRRHDRLFVDLL
jgi:ABC-type polysaccharide/polyol phosphate export permease